MSVFWSLSGSGSNSTLWTASRQIHLRKMFRKTKKLLFLSREVKRRLTYHRRLIGPLLTKIKLKTAEMKCRIPRIAILDRRQLWAATHGKLMIRNNNKNPKLSSLEERKTKGRRCEGVENQEQRAGRLNKFTPYRKCDRRLFLSAALMSSEETWNRDTEREKKQ